MQARQGLGYEEILAFYYKDVALMDVSTGSETLIAEGRPPPESDRPMERANPMPMTSDDTLPVILVDAEQPGDDLADAQPATQIPTRRPATRPKKRIGW
jgi:hypothetical protein